MMKVYYCGVLALFLFTTSWSAPVQEPKADENSVDVPEISQLADQEKELENLAALAAQNKGPYEVQQTHSMSYSNVNGKEQKDEEQEKKVLNSEKGDVIADVIQKLQQKPDSPTPVVETHVDVPSEGIHETFSEAVETPVDISDGENNADFAQYSPRIVAEYLLQFQDFQEFQNILEELVNSSMMTRQQAGDYKDRVRQEYNDLVEEEATRSRLSDYLSNSIFPSGYDLPEVPAKKSVDLYDQLPEDAYPSYDYSSFGSPNFESAKQSAIMDAQLDSELSLEEMIRNLLNDWIENAVLTGDPEAEAILNGIFEYVSKDDDPDDEGQVRDVLANLFADALLEEMSPREDVEPILPEAEVSNLESGSVQQTPPEDINENEAATTELKQESDHESSETKQEETNYEDVKSNPEVESAIRKLQM